MLKTLTKNRLNDEKNKSISETKVGKSLISTVKR